MIRDTGECFENATVSHTINKTNPAAMWLKTQERSSKYVASTDPVVSVADKHQSQKALIKAPRGCSQQQLLLLC